jgi:hypothetical protein
MPMRYLSIYTPAKQTAGPPSKEHMAAMEKLIEEYTKAGVLVTTGGLLPVSQGGARVRSSSGKSTVVDGPFTESKELVAGFAVLEVKSHDEVIERTKHFLTVAGDGECELRQIMGPDGGEGSAKA